MKLADHKPEFQKVVEHLRHELSSLRTGRAHPALLDGVMVEAYNSQVPLKTLASIAVPDHRTLQIEPWDKSLLKAIEKGIVAANLGLMPAMDSSVIRLAMPTLTEENRRELVKLMHKKVEEARVAARGVREKVRTAVLDAEKEKKISEDERYRLQEELEKMTTQHVEEIKTIAEEKEQEIMTV